MKEEVTRIMKLVQEGKISPEDAAELIEALSDHQQTSASEKTVGEAAAAEHSGKASSDSLMSAIENLTREVGVNVNWNEIAGQIRTSVRQGVEAIKQAGDAAAKGAGWSVFGQQFQKSVELPLNIQPGSTLVMEGFTGEVEIAATDSDYKVTINASLRSFSEAEAKEAAEKYTPFLEEGPSTVTLRHGETQNLYAHVKVSVPAGVMVDIKRLHGDASVVGTGTSTRIEVTSGDLSVERVGGQVELITASGDISLAATEATHVRIDTKSGDIHLNKVISNLNARTASGNVNMEECDGRTIAIDVASGDIEVDLARAVTGTVSIRTVSGDVNLEIPDGSDARLSASSTSGSVQIDHLNLNERNDGSRKITGKLGAGSGSIDVSSVSGDVTVSLRDSTRTVSA